MLHEMRVQVILDNADFHWWAMTGIGPIIVHSIETLGEWLDDGSRPLFCGTYADAERLCRDYYDPDLCGAFNVDPPAKPLPPLSYNGALCENMKN